MFLSSLALFRHMPDQNSLEVCRNASAVNDEGVFTGNSDNFVLCGFIRKEGRVSFPIACYSSRFSG